MIVTLATLQNWKKKFLVYTSDFFLDNLCHFSDIEIEKVWKDVFVYCKID
jgi:hypothetical protein